jgi:DNA-binding transcriptional LysR family regulator
MNHPGVEQSFVFHRNAKIDLALGVLPESQNGLDLLPIFRDELMFVFSPSHPWAAGRPITRDELRTQPLILYKHSSYTVRAVDDLLSQTEPRAQHDHGNRQHRSDQGTR